MSPDYSEVVAALPNYEVGSQIGRGAWGIVLFGRHRELGRAVAIKQLPRAFAADPTILSRFTAEAQLLASLEHPHIVPVYDYVNHEGLCLLIMELLPGGTLRDRFEAHGLTPQQSVQTVLAALAGLQCAHRHNVLHRDIKPENLMFSGSGTLKVTDFGIAKVVGGQETMATRTGLVMGTPAYMAPEQIRGESLSPATDVYAVAMVLYYLLSGQLAFRDDGNDFVLLNRHLSELPEPLQDNAPEVPAPIATLVMSGLATDPAERPQSAEEFGVALATASTLSWPTGWLSADGTPIIGAAAILAAAERATPISSIGGSQPDTVVRPEPAKASAGPRVVVRETVTRLNSLDSETELVPLWKVARVKVERRDRPVRRRDRTKAIAIAGILLAVGGVILALYLARSSPTSPPGPYLLPGKTLVAGQSLSSQNGRYRLQMQSDGNLVVYFKASDLAIWSSRTAGDEKDYAVMQIDGDLVIYPPGKSAPLPGQATSALWFSGTGGNPGAFLELQNDGDLVIMSHSSGRVLWQSDPML